MIFITLKNYYHKGKYTYKTKTSGTKIVLRQKKFNDLIFFQRFLSFNLIVNLKLIVFRCEKILADYFVYPSVLTELFHLKKCKFNIRP